MRGPRAARTVTDVRSLLIAVGVLLLIGVGGWVTAISRAVDDEGAVQRAKPPTTEEVEAFARFALPASARAVELQAWQGIDYAVEVRFVMDRADVEAFVASTGLQVERTGATLRAEESRPGYVRGLTVRLGPGTAAVQLHASEL